jgi:hypothetical protein
VKQLLAALVPRRVDRLLWSWRCPIVHALDPMSGRSGDEIDISLGTGRWWRHGLELRLTAEAADLLAVQLAENVVEARAWRSRSGPPPVHVGGNAEDCPACALVPSEEIPYPWHCPGPEQTPPGDHQDAGGAP